MGNSIEGDMWDQPEVRRWQTAARQTQTMFYNLFGGVHFDEYQNLSISQQVSKMCFAIYGAPENQVNLIADAYTEAQRNHAYRILDKIMNEWKKCGEKKLFVGVIFICCKDNEPEFHVPVFRFLSKYENNEVTAKWIDTLGRVYDAWPDWQHRNKMPLMKYCFPRHGYNSCLGGRVMEFNAEREPDVDYRTSPPANETARDLVDVSYAKNGKFLDFSPLYALGELAETIVNVSLNVTTLYQVGSAGRRLIDKQNHGEEPHDLESIALISSIIATPIKFVNSLINAKLSDDADGQIFTQNARILGMLAASTSIRSLFFLINLTYFVEKFERVEARQEDLLQFSMNCLFFENILIEPEVVKNIVRRGQQLKYRQNCESWSDEQTREAFRKFMENNRHRNNENSSKTFRELMKIENDDIFTN